MTDITIILAFIAGLVSFLSPCVVPIVPGFLSYLAGASAQELQTKRKDIFLSSVFFVLGFAAVFSALRVLLNTLLEAVAYDVQIWLSRIGGTLIIFFGLYLVGLIKILFLEKEYKVGVRFSAKGGSASGGKSRHLTSFIFGAAFAAGCSKSSPSSLATC